MYNPMSCPPSQRVRWRQEYSLRLIAGELLQTLRRHLPSTYTILRASNLTVHEGVYSVVLGGSRGLKGGHRPDSDVDISILADSEILQSATDKGTLLSEILRATLDTWRSPFEVDTAAIFDKRGCGLPCFRVGRYRELSCEQTGRDCFGIYKIQKGFNGFILTLA
jgi:predicted nucleotidyltransferase